MQILENLVSRVRKYKQDIPSIVGRAVKENEAIVIDYVVEDQLFEKGIRGNGESLGKYAPLTIAIKREKGQPTNRVTLRDTGDYHDSHSLQVTPEGGFAIRVTDFKYGELVERYGNIDALTDENLQDLLKSYILPELIEEFKKI